MAVEIGLNEEFDLLRYEKRDFGLVLPDARYPIPMSIFHDYDPGDVFDHESTYNPILVPSNPNIGYPANVVDAHFKGLEDKIKSLNPKVIKSWPKIYSRSGGWSVFDNNEYLGRNPLQLIMSGDPNETLPLPLEELFALSKRLFLTLSLKTGSFTSPNKARPLDGNEGTFFFDTFKPTDIAAIQNMSDYESHILIPHSGNIVIDYDKRGFYLCLYRQDTISGTIPAKFTLAPQSSIKYTSSES